MTDMKIGNRVAVTGCAGFIGSNLTERFLKEGRHVVGVDNFFTGSRRNLPRGELAGNFTFIEADITREGRWQNELAGCDTTFHMAAYPEAGAGEKDTEVHLKHNVIGTRNVLDGSAKKGRNIVFASSSTVYGEAAKMPTPEDYGPLKPIGIMGASKLGCEGYVAAYCHVFDAEGGIMRFANVVGRHEAHGVTYDFVRKLKQNPSELRIIGRDPGTVKSYVHIDDLMDGIMAGCARAVDRVEIYNVGTGQVTSVHELADIVASEMGLKGVSYKWTGGVDNGRGWKEDVKLMKLSVEKLKSRGWVAKLSSAEAIALTVRELLQEL